MKKHSPLLAAAALAMSLAQPALAADKIALVVKSLGNGFFDAAHQGALEAAKELKDVEIIYTGPAKATAEGHIEGVVDPRGKGRSVPVARCGPIGRLAVLPDQPG